MIATASASATVNLNRGLVNLRLGLVLEVATSLGGLAGGLVASRLSHDQLFLTFAATLTRGSRACSTRTPTSTPSSSAPP